MDSTCTLCESYAEFSAAALPPAEIDAFFAMFVNGWVTGVIIERSMRAGKMDVTNVLCTDHLAMVRHIVAKISADPKIATLPIEIRRSMTFGLYAVDKSR